MQNKPNFCRDKMNISNVLTKDYENKIAFGLRAKQTQSNPILSAIASTLRSKATAEDELAKADSNVALQKWAVTTFDFDGRILHFSANNDMFLRLSVWNQIQDVKRCTKGVKR